MACDNDSLVIFNWKSAVVYDEWKEGFDKEVGSLKVVGITDKKNKG